MTSNKRGLVEGEEARTNRGRERESQKAERTLRKEREKGLRVEIYRYSSPPPWLGEARKKKNKAKKKNDPITTLYI